MELITKYMSDKSQKLWFEDHYPQEKNEFYTLIRKLKTESTDGS